MSAQLGAEAAGTCVVGVSACAGAVLGLWAPRRLIQRRLSAATPTLPAPAPSVHRRDAGAASAIGSLSSVLSASALLALAVVCLGAAGLAAVYEGYRESLAAGFVAPPEMIAALRAGPGGLAGALLGAATTAVVVALHGWYRLLQDVPARVAPLWTSLLLGAVAALLVPPDLPSGALALPALAVFAAAVLALGLPPRPALPAAHHVPAAAPSRRDLAALSGAALSAAMAASTALSAPPPRAMTPVEVAAHRAPACVGALAGAAIGRWRFSAATSLSAVFAATGLAATATILPLDSGQATAAARSTITAAAAVAGIVFVARRISRATGSIQTGLAWTGAAAAAGCATGLTLAAVLVTFPEPIGGPPDPRSAGGDSDWIAALVEPGGLRSATVRIDGGDARGGRCIPPHDADASPLDVVIIDAVPVADSAPRPTFRADRLVRRCVASLAPGGRLVLSRRAALVSPALDRAARDAARARGWRAFDLSIEHDGAWARAVVFGDDVPAWVALRSRPVGRAMRLQPLDSPDVSETRPP